MGSKPANDALGDGRASRLQALRKGVRSVAIAIVAAIAVSYGESRAIERAPAFAAACLVALSSDFQRVLDSAADDTAARLRVAY